MENSLKIQWEKSKHYIGGFFGLSIKQLLFRVERGKRRFSVDSSLGERFDLQIFSGERGQSCLKFFLPSGPTQNGGHLFSTRERPPNSFTKKSKAIAPCFNFVTRPLVGTSSKLQIEQKSCAFFSCKKVTS